MFNHQVCTMLEQPRLEFFHMAAEQFTVKPEPERCITVRVALQFSRNQHAHPLSHLHRSLWCLCQNRRQDALVEAKDSVERENQMLPTLIQRLSPDIVIKQ